jgi:hypothetical protein
MAYASVTVDAASGARMQPPVIPAKAGAGIQTRPFA